MTAKRTLITGASGYLGLRLTRALHAHPDVTLVVATDIRNPETVRPGVVYEHLDVTDPRRVDGLIADFRIDTIVHLAWNGGQWPGDPYRVDVDGTSAVLDAALHRDVSRLIVASGEDVYGFKPRPSVALDEATAELGDDTYLETHHKVLVEQALAGARDKDPDLAQVVLRFAAVLGDGALNSVTALLAQPEIIVDSDLDSRLTCISTDDAVAALVHAVVSDASGTFNVAGDGSIRLRNAARLVGAPVWDGNRRQIERHLRRADRRGDHVPDPELLDLLWHRPVLSNEALKSAFGFQPALSSEQAFEEWARGLKR